MHSEKLDRSPDRFLAVERSVTNSVNDLRKVEKEWRSNLGGVIMQSENRIIGVMGRNVDE
jgi:hypothetical protein